MTKYEEEQQEAECQRLGEIRSRLYAERNRLSKELLPNNSKEINDLKNIKELKIKELNLQKKKLKDEFNLKCKQIRKKRNDLRKNMQEFKLNKELLDEANMNCQEAYKKLNEIRKKNYDKENLLERRQENNGN